MSWRSIAVPALLALLSTGPSAGQIAAQQAVSVHLSEQNASELFGEVTLTPLGQQTKVALKVTGAGPGPQPAHIHTGTCANLDPKPAFPLSSVLNGASETTVDTPLALLQSQPMAINVHRSPQEAAVYVACGNIPLTQASIAGAPADQPPVATGPAAQPSPVAQASSSAQPAPSPTATRPAGPTSAPAAPVTTVQPVASPSPAPAQARPPAQLPRTGDSDYQLYVLLAAGAAVTLVGLGLAIRRRPR